MFGVRGLSVSALMELLAAYNRKDWDAMWAALQPLLPMPPDDGNPRTMTPARRVFSRAVPALDLPSGFASTLTMYLANLSDRQLDDLADGLRLVVRALDAERDRETNATDTTNTNDSGAKAAGRYPGHDAGRTLARRAD